MSRPTPEDPRVALRIGVKASIHDRIKVLAAENGIRPARFAAAVLTDALSRPVPPLAELMANPRTCARLGR